MFDRPRSKWDPVHWRGLAYRKMEETNLCWTSYGRNGVMLIGRGVAYRKTEEADLCWSATVETGVLFISTVDLLQPPRAPVHPASTARYSTGYCSTTPPPSTVHPALHTSRSCSSGGNATAHCSSKPPSNAHSSSNRSASVSSSSEGIAPSGSVNSHRSIARVQ